MIASGIAEFPERLMAWIRAENSHPDSPIFEAYSLVHSAEQMPDLVSKNVARDSLPGLIGVYQSWTQVEIEGNSSCDQIAGEHRINLLSLRRLRRGDRAGVRIRDLTSRLVSLFIQHRPHRPVRGPTGQLWRPEDTESLGLSLYRLTVERADLMDPLPGGKGSILIERSSVELRAVAISRHPES